MVHGVFHNGDTLDPRAQDLGALFEAAGYDTAAFVNTTFLRSVASTFQHKDNRPGLSENVVDAALRWLEAPGRTDRFFLWVHSFDPHHWPTTRSVPKEDLKAIRDATELSPDYAANFLDFLEQARKNMATFNKWGIKTLVTACADCYHAFKVLYDKFDFKGDLEVLHITEYLDQLIKEGQLKPTRQIDLKVTYQDPCHLGRLGEPWIRWKGKEIPGPIRLFDPPRDFMRGTYGVYDAPRDILRSIPGLKLVEMDRIKEYAWCCGGGGGVKENNPDFARWTAAQRISEAKSTGAEALVTACTGCRSLFAETLEENGKDLKVYDITEILDEVILKGGQ